MRRRFLAGAVGLAAVLLVTTWGDAAPRTAPGDAAVFGPVALPYLQGGATATVDVPVTNAGTTTWTSPPVYLAYHWYAESGGLVVWDGLRTSLGAAMPPGTTRTVSARVAVPATARTYTLSFELVREGVAWLGGAVAVPAVVPGETYRAAYLASAGATAGPGASLSLPVTVTNVGSATWTAAGGGAVALAYHVYDRDGALVLWDGTRTPLGTPLLPGQSRALALAVTAPGGAGDYTVRVDAVREGVAWLSSLGSPGADVPLRVPGVYGAIGAPDTMWAGAYGVASVELTNTTPDTWRAGGANPVRLSYHVYTSTGALEVWDGVRTSLPYDVAPGARVRLDPRLRAPAGGGDRVFAWDLVEEGVAWFSSRGISFAADLVTVRALPASLQGAEWYRIPTAERVVALTFDCGANADGAATILDTLARTGVPATFFMCGSFVDRYPDVARTIASRHPVGNHTLTHPDLRTVSDDAVATEILEAEDTIRAVLGVDPHPLFRFPYGASDARTIALANAYGYGGFRWTVDTLGWEGTSGGRSVETVTERVLAALQPGAIVLMHVGSNPDDRSTLDADALAGVIDAIRARGYAFVTLPQYLP